MKRSDSPLRTEASLWQDNSASFVVRITNRLNSTAVLASLVIGAGWRLTLH